MYLVFSVASSTDDDTPKVPSPVDDTLMSPQARRYWLNLKRQSESGFYNAAASSAAANASSRH
jgi:hypothetical protein